MPFFSGRIVLLLSAALAIAGCRPFIPKGKSPLAATHMSPDAVVLECFFVRVPFGDPKSNHQLWQDVDEQHFPAELRRRLARNGFRVGLAGGQLPVALSELLELKDKPAPVSGGAHQSELTGMESEPRVVRRHLPIRTGRRKEIVTSGVYDALPVLLRDSGRLSGETYSQAQGLLAVKTFPQGDGRVRLEITPELHHDRARQRWVGDQGVLRLEAGRPRRAFDDLAFSATLLPGSMLILSSLPNLPGSLGHHFFTECDGQLEQKLLVVRLAQTQHDELFSAAEVLPLP